MFSFSKSAPLDLTTYTPPPPEDRSGPPLTQGLLFTMIATVAAEHCTGATLQALSKIDPDAWYHGQLLETLLDGFAARDQELPAFLGRNIYFMLRPALKQMGMDTPTAVVQSLPALWLQATRGDGGELRSTLLGRRKARVEMEQPYNCLFEEGAVRGFLEALDAVDVHIAHAPCKRTGAPFCSLEISWEE
jgi:hypothetical protein